MKLIKNLILRLIILYYLMLSTNNDYKNKIIENLKIIHSVDYLPKLHCDYLFYLKNKWNFNPKIIYDIGSCVLHWERHAKNTWPTSDIILFDAFEPVEYFYANYKYHIGVLSDQDNKIVKFYQNDMHPGGNSYYRELVYDIYPKNNFLLKITRTLDSIVKEKNFPQPDLIKIDVQGAELDIINGALEVLKNTKILIVELQDFNYNENAPNVTVSKPYIESLGWICIGEKFSNNTHDADYCFINKKFINI